MVVPVAEVTILRREGGVALVTVLLIVALATVAAVTLAARQPLDVRRTANLLENGQAAAYAKGVEDWGRVILTRDRKDGEIDHPGEDWATLLPPMIVEGGQVSGFVEDLQGRFNLNDMIQAGADNPHQIKRFQRLLEALGLDPGLVTAVLDWMDEDVNARFPDGAEDDFYLSEDTPYRTPNRPFASPSELRLVKGFDAEMVTTLLPHVCALATASRVNVNTATVAVLRSIADGMTDVEAEMLIEGRGEDGYKDMQTFLQQDALAGREVVNQGLAVASEHFLLHAEVRIGDSYLRSYTTVQRNSDGQTIVLARSYGTQ